MIEVEREDSPKDSKRVNNDSNMEISFSEGYIWPFRANESSEILRVEKTKKSEIKTEEKLEIQKDATIIFEHLSRLTQEPDGIQALFQNSFRVNSQASAEVRTPEFSRRPMKDSLVKESNPPNSW